MNLLVVLVAMAVALAGSIVGPYPRVANAEVEIVIAPPPIPLPGVVIVPERPSYGHVWIGPSYEYDGGRYVSVPGRWEVPPSRDHHWVEPYWQQNNNGHSWNRGHWQN